MKAEDGDRVEQCPCCKTCTNCPSHFEKVANLKKSGVIIYLHKKNVEQMTVQNQNYMSAASFILRNTKDIPVTTRNVIRDIEQKKLACPRCRELMKRALNLLNILPDIAINKNDITGICDHCKLKQPCYDCKEAVNNFVTKSVSSENAKKRVNEWLSKVDKPITNTIDTDGNQNKAHSESRLMQQLHKEFTRSKSDLVVTELFGPTKRSPVTKKRDPTIAKEKLLDHEFDSSEHITTDQAFTIVDPSGKVIKLPIPKSEIDGEEKQFYPSDVHDHIGISTSAPETTRDHREAEFITKDKLSLRRSPLVPFQSEDDFVIHLKDSIEDDKPGKAQDVKSRIHISKSHKHDIVPSEFIDEEKEQQYNIPADYSRHFSFSFPQKKVLKRQPKHKSSSELIRDTQTKLREKAKQDRQRLEDERNKKLERKRIASEKKMKLMEEKKKNSKETIKPIESEEHEDVLIKDKDKQKDKSKIESDVLDKQDSKVENFGKKGNKQDVKVGRDISDTRLVKKETKQKDGKENLQKNESSKKPKQKDETKKEPTSEVNIHDIKIKHKDADDREGEEVKIGSAKKEKGSATLKENLAKEKNKYHDQTKSDENENQSAKAIVKAKQELGEIDKNKPTKIPKSKTEDKPKEIKEKKKADPAIDINKIKVTDSLQGNVVAKIATPQKIVQQSKQKEDIDTNGLEYILKQKKTRGINEPKIPKANKEVKPDEENKMNVKPTPTVKEPKQKEVNIEGVKVRRPSQDYFILELVKLKQANKNNICLSDIMTPLEIENHRTLHKTVKQEKCFLCINSDIEIGYDIRKTKSKATSEMIKGQKLFKYKHPYVSKTEKEELVPSLFQKNFTEFPSVEINDKELPSSATVADTSSPRPVGKHLKSATETEVETKGVIRYALSDRSFIDKGWTMLPTEKVVRKMNVYRMRPAHPEFDWFEHNKSKGLMTYDTGERLAEFNDNGRGRWYYRSGRLALDYYDAEELNAQQRFVIYSTGQPDERGRSQPYTVIATFDYLGNGVVFDHSGKIRLKYNQTEGVVLDRNIGPVSHWKWHTLNDPPVLQQVMIDTQMSHKDPDILKMGGPQDNKPRPDNEEMLAIEFDNFIKEKSKKLTQSFKPFQIKMKALKINEHFSLKVLDQATVYLIFRDGTTNLKLNIGMVLDHKEIVDTDTAEVGEVSNSLERFPARTDSLAVLQKSVAYAQRFERNRTERERRLRPTEPCASADKLIAAASRPMRLPLRSVHSSTTATASAICKCNRKPNRNNTYYDNRLL